MNPSPRRHALSVAEARAQVLASIHRLPAQEVPLEEAHGCSLARDAVASDPVPPFTNSAMDGYAVRYADLASTTPEQPVALAVIGEAPAGSSCAGSVNAGQAVRIMTGAPLPAGADTVIPFEQTTHDPHVVTIVSPCSRGANVRHAGEDVPQGAAVLAAGAVLHAGAIGLLAGLGQARVHVTPRPTVAIVATGDELLPITAPLTPGRIRNSNAWALAAQARECGALPRVLPIAPDDRTVLRERLDEASQADVIVTSGGVSVGDFDLVKEVLAEGGKMDFWTVRQRPGKPLAFGWYNGKPLFGLPGNPSASMVSFDQYVRPALLKLAHQEHRTRPEIEVTLAEDMRKRPGLTTFIAVVLELTDRGTLARRAGPQRSGSVLSMSHAQGLLVLPEELPEARAGDRGTVQLWYPEELA